MDEILSAIEEALKRKKISASAASQLAVGHPAFVKNLRNRRGGDRLHPVEALERLAAVLDMELYLGPKRDSDPPPGAKFDDTDFVAVNRSAARASAGPGALNEGDMLDPLLFRRDWLRRIGVAPSDACLLNVDGESMAPLISSGDMVMIDTSRVLPPVRPKPTGGAHSRIYVLDDDDHTRVKYVERRREDEVMVYSENSARYAPDIYQGADIERLRIRGKVVWWAHTVRGDQRTRP